MTVPLAKKIDGKKYMWDGKTYENEEQARETMASYEKDGFTVHIVRENDMFLVYSRRLATVQTDA